MSFAKVFEREKSENGHSRKFMCAKVSFRSFAKVNERESFCARKFLRAKVSVLKVIIYNLK